MVEENKNSITQFPNQKMGSEGKIDITPGVIEDLKSTISSLVLEKATYKAQSDQIITMYNELSAKYDELKLEHEQALTPKEKG